MATIGDAFIELKFDTKRLAAEARRAAKIAVAAASIGGLASVFAGLGASAIAAVPNVAALVGQLVAIAPAALALIPAIATVVAGFATLKLATSGVGDAISAVAEGDAAKLDEALRKLAPAARTFVREIQAAFPALKQFQQFIQQKFFEQFAGALTPVIKNLLPTFRLRLGEIASAAGEATRQVFAFLATGYAKQQLDAVLLTARNSFQSLALVPRQVTEAILIMLTTARPVIEQLAVSIAATSKIWIQKLRAMRDSGELTQIIQNGIANLKLLIHTVADFAVGFSNAMRIAGESGGSPLQLLSQLAAKFRVFTESVAGQQAIRQFFAGFQAVSGTLSAVLSQVLTNILPALGTALKQLAGPATSIVNTLGPLLADALRAVAPVLTTLARGFATGLSQLRPAIAPLGAALGQVAKALAPVLSLLGQVIAQVVQRLAPALPPIANLLAAAFSAVAPILAPLATVLATVVSQLAVALLPAVRALTPLFVKLGQILVDLAPDLGKIAALLGQLLTDAIVALMPHIVRFMQIFGAQLIQIMPAVISQLAALGPVFGILLQVLTQALPHLLGFMEIMVPLATGVIVGVITAISWLVRKLAELILWVNQGSGLVYKFGFAIGYAGAAVAYFAYLAGKAIFDFGFAVGYVIGKVIAYFVSLPYKAGAATGAMVNKVIGYVSGMRGRVIGLVANIASWLYNAGRNLIVGLINGINGMAGQAYKSLTDLLANLRRLLPFSPAKDGPFSGRGYTTYAGAAMIRGLADGILSEKGTVYGALATVMAGAQPALAGLGVTGLSTAGTATSGVEARLREIVDAVERVAPGVGQQINGVGRSLRQSARAGGGLA